MSAEENAEFEQAAGYLLDELGYETATPEGGLDPARGVGAVEGSLGARPADAAGGSTEFSAAAERRFSGR